MRGKRSCILYSIFLSSYFTHFSILFSRLLLSYLYAKYTLFLPSILFLLKTFLRCGGTRGASTFLILYFISGTCIIHFTARITLLNTQNTPACHYSFTFSPGSCVFNFYHQHKRWPYIHNVGCFVGFLNLSFLGVLIKLQFFFQFCSLFNGILISFYDFRFVCRLVAFALCSTRRKKQKE